MYKLLFSSQAKKDAKNLSKSGLKQKNRVFAGYYRTRPVSISSQI